MRNGRLRRGLRFYPTPLAHHHTTFKLPLDFSYRSSYIALLRNQSLPVNEVVRRLLPQWTPDRTPTCTVTGF